MKVSTILAVAVLVSMCLFGHLCDWSATSVAQAQDPKSKTLELNVTGMTCTACAGSIQSALSKKEGVIENDVRYSDGIAVIKYKTDKLTEKDLIEVIEKAGFKAKKKNDQDGKDQKKSSVKAARTGCC